MNYNGMGSDPNTRFMLAGCSAGGRGVMAALDAVADMLPSSIQFSGMIDAAAWVDVPPPSWEAGLLSLQQMTADVAGFSQPPLGSCAQVYQGADSWKCLWSSYRMPLIKTPYFINAAQFDAFQVLLQGPNPPTLNLNRALDARLNPWPPQRVTDDVRSG